MFLARPGSLRAGRALLAPALTNSSDHRKVVRLMETSLVSQGRKGVMTGQFLAVLTASLWG